MNELLKSAINEQLRKEAVWDSIFGPSPDMAKYEPKSSHKRVTPATTIYYHERIEDETGKVIGSWYEDQNGNTWYKED